MSILFGTERISLEFYDVEALERLHALAEEGAQRLRAAISLNDRPTDDVAVDRLTEQGEASKRVDAGGRSA